jgi:signal transduction histidine kinase
VVHALRRDAMDCAAKQHEIFEPFQRAGQETGSIPGTGIGLATVKQLAELKSADVSAPWRNLCLLIEE